MLGELRSQAETRGLTTDCIFVPATGQVAEWLHAIDIFVLPSRSEALSNSLLEAMGCGLPAIASTATAGADVLTDASGRLLAPGDVDAFVDALQWFDKNRDLLPAMGRAARKKAEECSWDRYRRAVSEATSRFL